MIYDDGPHRECSVRPIIIRATYFTSAHCACGWNSQLKPRRSKYSRHEVAGQWREHKRMTDASNRI